jgi:hypothetical protein
MHTFVAKSYIAMAGDAKIAVAQVNCKFIISVFVARLEMTPLKT